MDLTANTLSVSNTTQVTRLTVGNAAVIDTISLGSVSIGAAAANIGNVSISPSRISTPSLIVGGISFDGGFNATIVDYQEFTGDGIWYNPAYIVRTDFTPGLQYQWFTQSTAVNASDASILATFFDTVTSVASANITVTTYGGEGSYYGSINWGTRSGAGGITDSLPIYLPEEQFSWKASGYLYAPETGLYSFGIDGDDAIDLWVDGVNVAYWYGPHSFSTGGWSSGSGYGGHYSGSLYLTANTYYTFEARMQQGTGGAGIQVGWKKPSDAAIAVIPGDYFYKKEIVSVANPKFTGYEQVIVGGWGGGGGGYSNTTNLQGGGGGACVFAQFSAAELDYFCPVVVGKGGSVGNNASAATTGGTSYFAATPTSRLFAYGGVGGTGAGTGGGGGGVLGAGSGVTGGAPLGGAGGGTGGVSTFGGGGGFTGTPFAGGASIFGGGGGGATGVGGASIYGGAGGTGTNAVAVSIFGGNGGNSTVRATAPGGGGGMPSVTGGNTFYNGARGEVRVWVLGKGSTTTAP